MPLACPARQTDMNKKTLLFSALAGFTLFANAQTIVTDNEVIDLGNIIYETPSTATFQLKNNGHEPLVLQDVKTSCGCTKAEYPKQPIQPGESFSISATYDARQLGHFLKDIALYSNVSPKPYYLSIRGVVVEELVDFTGTYPFTIADVSVDKNDIEFDDVNRGDRPIQKIHIKNVSTKSVSPTVMHLPEYIEAIVSPTTIMPGREGVVSLVLDSRKLRDYGLTQTSVFLGMFPGDKVAANKEISVSAVLLPAFRELTDNDLAAAPQLRISHEQLDMDFRGKSKKSETITLENVGRTPLDISSLQMFTTGLKVKLSKSRLMPNEKATLKITGEAKLLKAARSKPRVIMITNDPMKPKVIININVK